MPKKVKPQTELETNTDTPDALLEQVSKVAGPLADAVEQSEDHALLIIGAKYMEDKEHGEGVQTFTLATGYFGILAEGLYAELSDQLKNGQPALFAVLREVIHDIEEEFDIDDETELGTDDTSTLH